MTLYRETPCEQCGHIGPHSPFSNPWYAHPNHGGTRTEVTIRCQSCGSTTSDVGFTDGTCNECAEDTE
jgi:hypothetical protein